MFEIVEFSFNHDFSPHAWLKSTTILITGKSKLFYRKATL